MMKLSTRIAQYFLMLLSFYYFLLGIFSFLISFKIFIPILEYIGFGAILFGMAVGLVPEVFFTTINSSGGPFLRISFSPFFVLLSTIAIVLSFLGFKALRNFKSDTKALHIWYWINSVSLGSAVWNAVVIFSVNNMHSIWPPFAICLLIFFSIKILREHNKPAYFKNSKRIFLWIVFSIVTFFVVLYNYLLSGSSLYFIIPGFVALYTIYVGYKDQKHI